MSDAEDRLGTRGSEEIKSHPFFLGIDWDNMRNKASKYANPNLKDDDTTKFDNFDEEESFYPVDERKSKKQRKDINFVGYTYKADVEDQKVKLVQALQETLNTDFPNAENSKYTSIKSI